MRPSGVGSRAARGAGRRPGARRERLRVAHGASAASRVRPRAVSKPKGRGCVAPRSSEWRRGEYARARALPGTGGQGARGRERGGREDCATCHVRARARPAPRPAFARGLIRCRSSVDTTWLTPTGNPWAAKAPESPVSTTATGKFDEYMSLLEPAGSPRGHQGAPPPHTAERCTLPGRRLLSVALHSPCPPLRSPRFFLWRQAQAPGAAQSISAHAP